MTRRRCRGRGDAGFVSAWTVAVAVACWAMVGLVVDGGRTLRERSSAFGAAAAAARAGVQEIDERAAVEGVLELDEDAAASEAHSFLSARGFDGTVSIDGIDVTVTVTGATGMTILPAASVPYTVTATARAVQGDGPV